VATANHLYLTAARINVTGGLDKTDALRWPRNVAFSQQSGLPSVGFIEGGVTMSGSRSLLAG
jgi:hypothetical protein